MEENKYVVVEYSKNVIGLAGFILSIISFFVDFIPGIGWVVWILTTIFNIVGLFKKPRNLVIAGTIISCFCLILLLFTVIFVASVTNSLRYLIS